jgi:hypothetical protein
MFASPLNVRLTDCIMNYRRHFYFLNEQKKSRQFLLSLGQTDATYRQTDRQKKGPRRLFPLCPDIIVPMADN